MGLWTFGHSYYLSLSCTLVQRFKPAEGWFQSKQPTLQLNACLFAPILLHPLRKAVHDISSFEGGTWECMAGPINLQINSLIAHIFHNFEQHGFTLHGKVLVIVKVLEHLIMTDELIAYPSMLFQRYWCSRCPSAIWEISHLDHPTSARNSEKSKLPSALSNLLRF